MRYRINVGDVIPVHYETHILDESNNVSRILAASEGHRIYASYEQFPEDLINAVITIEDKRFWKHHGADIIGMLRSVVTIIRTRGRKIQGGSTITQQLIKNTVCSGWYVEKSLMQTLSRKVREVILAVKLEKQTDKQHLLEYYLNTIYFGNDCYGVEKASQFYFNKSINDLDLSECALLAGIPKNPRNFGPFIKPDFCDERRQFVLNRMLKGGMITQEQHSEYYMKNTLEKIFEIRDKRTAFPEYFSWYEDALIDQVRCDLCTKLGISLGEASQRIYSGGLRIFSAISKAHQKICEDVCEDISLIPDGENDDHLQAAVILMDIHSGRILAHIGGNGQKQGSLLFDRGIHSRRNAKAQYIKGFLYRTRCEDTFENGICLADMCAAFSAYENGGGRIKPLFYKKVTDSMGKTVLRGKTQISSDNVQYRFPMPECTEIAMDKDLWIIGSIKDMVLGVWSGYDDDRDIPFQKEYYTYAKKVWDKIKDGIGDVGYDL